MSTLSLVSCALEPMFSERLTIEGMLVSQLKRHHVEKYQWE